MLTREHMKAAQALERSYGDWHTRTNHGGVIPMPPQKCSVAGCSAPARLTAFGMPVCGNVCSEWLRKRGAFE